MSKTKIGMREVAERAGVAISTVSHALNSTAPISDEVRMRVLDAARELGYLAKRTAKATIGTLNRILMVAPEDALPDSDVNLVSWTILNTLTRDCDARGIRIVPYALGRERSVAAIAAAARDANVDGIILLNDDRSSLLEAIRKTGIPSVLINGEDPEMRIDSVTPGNRFAAMKATKRLIALGHKRIVHLSWRGRKTVDRRRDGFLDAFEESGISRDNALILMTGGYEPQHGEAAVRDWLKAHPDLQKATAMFCAADNLAFGAIRALQAAGLRVPEDMSVMGFDGVALSEFHEPPLSTIAIPLEQFGQAALSLLEQRANSGDATRAAHRLELGCEIIERASVAAVSSR
jgi:DNA-binding LacI/PurR family transcriptional regulator